MFICSKFLQLVAPLLNICPNNSGDNWMKLLSLTGGRGWLVPDPSAVRLASFLSTITVRNYKEIILLLNPYCCQYCCVSIDGISHKIMTRIFTHSSSMILPTDVASHNGSILLDSRSSEFVYETLGLYIQDLVEL